MRFQRCSQIVEIPTFHIGKVDWSQHECVANMASPNFCLQIQHETDLCDCSGALGISKFQFGRVDWSQWVDWPRGVDWSPLHFATMASLMVRSTYSTSTYIFSDLCNHYSTLEI